MFGRVKSGPPEYLVAALGNPGRKYEKTRHNIGMTALNYIEKEEGFNCDRLRFNALCAEAVFADKKVLFMRPQTYMNNSGDAIHAAASYYKIPAENCVVLCDDISLPVAKIRIRPKGSAGGHNGLKSIIAHIGDSFPRIKIGVGAKPSPDSDLADYVLGDFSSLEQKALTDIFPDIKGALELIVAGKISDAMNRYN